MRTIIKLMVLCLSCILLGTTNVQAAEKSLQAKERLDERTDETYRYSYADSYYGYVSYEWEDAETCIRYTVKEGKLQKKKIPFRGKAKKYAKKFDGLDACQWMDAKGNFYFQTYEPRKKNGKTKDVYFLNKVNKKGKLVKRIKLNDWLKIDNSKKDPDGYYSYYYDAKNHYELSIERVEEREVIAEYSDGKKAGYVIFDRNTGKVKRQIITYEESENEDPENEPLYDRFYHKQMLFTVSKDGRLFYEKVTAGKKITLSSGNKIRYQKVKKRKQIGQLPGEVEAGPAKRKFGAYKNYVYLLAPEGYYRISTKDLSLEKLASTSELPFWKNEYSDIEFSTLLVLSKKKCIFGLFNYTGETDEHVKLLIWQGTIS